MPTPEGRRSRALRRLSLFLAAPPLILGTRSAAQVSSPAGARQAPWTSFGAAGVSIPLCCGLDAAGGVPAPLLTAGPALLGLGRMAAVPDPLGGAPESPVSFLDAGDPGAVALDEAGLDSLIPVLKERPGLAVVMATAHERLGRPGTALWLLRRLSMRMAAGYPGDAALKARRLTETTFVVVDVEATGFYPEVERLFEVGAVKFRLSPDGTVVVLGTFMQKIDPKMPVPEVVARLTGVTPAELRGQPVLLEALPGLRAFLDDDAVLLAHKAAFDVSHLGWGMDGLGVAAWPNMVLDTKQLVLSLFPEVPSARLKDLIRLWGLRETQEHRGLPDAWDAAWVLSQAARRLSERTGLPLGELRLGDLAEHTVVRHFDSILEELAPLAVEPGRLRAVPEDFEQEFLAVAQQRHLENKPGMLRDLAYALGYDYAELRDRLRRLIPDAAP